MREITGQRLAGGVKRKGRERFDSIPLPSSLSLLTDAFRLEREERSKGRGREDAIREDREGR